MQPASEDEWRQNMQRFERKESQTEKKEPEAKVEKEVTREKKEKS
jgi:hypothetical protein